MTLQRTRVAAITLFSATCCLWAGGRAQADDARPHSGGGEALYAFPYRTADLGDDVAIFRGKRIHSDSGPQKWGYDLDAARRPPSTRRWSRVWPSYDPRNPKNADFVVYGQKVYAMSAGTVIACWRNAPENPRPFSQALGDRLNQNLEERGWLPESLQSGRIPVHGNHLWVKEPDGDLVLYAHAQAGSIPNDLCPHNRTLYSKPRNASESVLAAKHQIKISTGQFLFRTGSSGNSTAPHLHVHVQSSHGRPLVLRFKHVRYKRVEENRLAPGPWQRLNGEALPAGPVLIRP